VRCRPGRWAKCAEGGGSLGSTALRFLPLTLHLLRLGRAGLERVSPAHPPPPAPRRREGLGNGEVEFPILRPDKEAFPFVAIEDVGLLAAIL